MILIRLIVALAVSLPVSSWAAIAFVSQTDATGTQNVSSVTFSQVVSAGTDRALFVCSQVRHNATPGKSITGVTFNGSEAFTLVRADARNGASSAQFITEIWRLAAPTVTTANVVITYNGSNVDAIGASATLLTGVSQTSPVDSHAGSSGAGTAIAAIITTVSDNAWIIDCAIGRHNSGMTIGAGQTSRSNRTIGSVVDDAAGVSTVNGKTPAGAETMNWTQGGEDWSISTVSVTPSGGSDPAPTVPSQVTLGWTNGTDPGTSPSGIANTTIRRCTGTGCNATIAPAIATRGLSSTSYVDTTVLPNTTYGYSNYHTDGAGNVSTNHATVRITTSGTAPPAAPTIATAAFDNTGVTVTYGAVTPTKNRVFTYVDTRVVSNIVYELSDFPGGRFTETWRDGLTGGCVEAIDANGIDNITLDGYKCGDFAAFVDPIDTTPPTLSGCQPAGTLPAGTVSWTFSCLVNKPDTSAKYDTVDTTYALMANTMSLNSLTFSAIKAGLTNGSTTTLYLRGATVHPFEVTGPPEDEVPVVYPATTSTVVTLTVAASTADVTPPADVTGLTATLIGNGATLAWNAAVDAVSYQVYLATGGCTEYAPSGNPVITTTQQLELSFGVVYCWKVKALDVVSNFSTNFSNIVTVTTPPAPDIERPSDLADMTVTPYTSTVLLTWTRGTDNSGQVFTNIEYCAVATGQTDCANFAALVGEISQTFLTPQNLTPGARYCYRGKNADPTGNVSLNYNTPICETTPTIGLPSPRDVLQFGVDRATITRDAAGARDVRQ